METDKRVEALESELKLMKGEVKQTLAGVRDYLVNLKLPASQEATLLAAAISGGGSDMSVDGKFTIEKKDDDKSVRDTLPGKEPTEDGASEDGVSEEGGPSEPELSQEEEQMERGKTGLEMGLSVPPVNLIANLVRWVANAKKQIGGEQLPAFLEVYGISGHLSNELKETILQLAGMTAAAQPEDASAADRWSQLMLELHGILAGGTAPLRPLGPFWNNGGNGSRQEKKPVTTPSKLKLVLSGGDGKDKEFSLDLKPNED